MPPRSSISIPAGIILVLLTVVADTKAQDDKPVPAAVVTIKGNVLCNRATATKPWNWDPKDGDHTPVMFAVEGTPEIAGQVRSIMSRYPERGLDVDDALRIQDEFTQHLKFFIVPGPIAQKVHKEVEAGSRLLALTGTLARKDGRNWITVTRAEPAKVNYPARMLAPDRPFSPPAGEPLALKVNDKLTLKCILLPAGRFLAGSPFYQRRYQDEYPHEVVLTRPFYMSEIPITQEIYEAVMGTNPSLSKGVELSGRASSSRRHPAILPDSVGEERRHGASANRRRVGVRGPRRHVQSLLHREIQRPAQRDGQPAQHHPGPEQEAQRVGPL